MCLVVIWPCCRRLSILIKWLIPHPNSLTISTSVILIESFNETSTTSLSVVRSLLHLKLYCKSNDWNFSCFLSWGRRSFAATIIELPIKLGLQLTKPYLLSYAKLRFSLCKPLWTSRYILQNDRKPRTRSPLFSVWYNLRWSW